MIANVTTGQQPTATELKQIEARAIEILESPYSSPEQIEWALNVAPPGFEMIFWQSTKEAAQDKRRF